MGTTVRLNYIAEEGRVYISALLQGIVVPACVQQCEAHITLLAIEAPNQTPPPLQASEFARLNEELAAIFMNHEMVFEGPPRYVLLHGEPHRVIFPLDDYCPLAEDLRTLLNHLCRMKGFQTLNRERLRGFHLSLDGAPSPDALVELPWLM